MTYTFIRTVNITLLGFPIFSDKYSNYYYIIDLLFQSRSRATSIADSVYASTIMSGEVSDARSRFAMNDQQWVLQRKKIGLSRRNKKVLQNKLAAEKQKMSAITYIQTHFNRKECTKFIGDPAITLDQCLCGLKRDKHKTRRELEAENEELYGTKFSSQDMDKISEVSESDHVDPEASVTDSLADLLHTPDHNPHAYQRSRSRALKETQVVARSVLELGDRNEPGNYNKSDAGNNTVKHIQEFSTNAYGQIEFEGMQASKLAKYLRLADNTTLASVKEFVCDYWNLMKPRPHLALSIVGGAKNFKLDGRKKETFKRGLIAAAQAWLDILAFFL